MIAGAEVPDDDGPGGTGGADTGRAPLDLSALLRDIDRQWPGWERCDGRAVHAPWGFLLGVEFPGGRLLHRPLPSHPARALIGWVAPGRWCAVGVAVRGTAHRPDDGRHTAADARVIWVCHRDGRSASLLGLAGEPVTVVVTDPDGRHGAAAADGPDGGTTQRRRRRGDGAADANPDEEGRVPRLLREALAPPPPDVSFRPGLTP